MPAFIGGFLLFAFSDRVNQYLRLYGYQKSRDESHIESTLIFDDSIVARESKESLIYKSARYSNTLSDSNIS
jgi:hypothetical protein